MGSNMLAVMLLLSYLPVTSIIIGCHFLYESCVPITVFYFTCCVGIWNVPSLIISLPNKCGIYIKINSNTYSNGVCRFFIMDGTKTR